MTPEPEKTTGDARAATDVESTFAPESPPQNDRPAVVPEIPETSAEAPSETPAISDEMASRIDQAMDKASTPPSPGAHPVAHDPRPTLDPDRPRPAIRGPRVVQAGREHRKGAVVSVGPEDIFIEFGPKELGVAKRPQWPDAELPKVGDALEVVVDRYEPNEQLFLCSRPGAIQKAEWELLEAGQTVEVRVTGVNKGGLECEVAGHRAFMPASRVDVRRIEDLSIFVGEKLACKISQVDRAGRGNIVLSRREIVKDEQKALRESLKDSLKEGQTVEGVVRKIMDFGAFVDIGGIDGLVHVSDLSHERVGKVEDVVKEGDKVSAVVTKIDWERNRISLSMKETQPDPFAQAQSAITAGEEVTGRVTKIMEFGAFVEVAPGVEGLVHVSELSWRRVPSPDAVVKPDQVVKVKVLEVDPDRRRVSLSIKQLTEQPAAMQQRGRRGAKGEQDTRSAEEILKETPKLRRLREQSRAKTREQGLKSGLGDVGGMGLGELGELKLG